MEYIKIYTKPQNGINGYKISGIDCSDGIDKDTNTFNIALLLCRLRVLYGYSNNNSFAYTLGFNFGG